MPKEALGLVDAYLAGTIGTMDLASKMETLRERNRPKSVSPSESER